MLPSGLKDEKASAQVQKPKRGAEEELRDPAGGYLAVKVVSSPPEREFGTCCKQRARAVLELIRPGCTQTAAGLGRSVGRSVGWKETRSPAGCLHGGLDEILFMRRMGLKGGRQGGISIRNSNCVII